MSMMDYAKNQTLHLVLFFFFFWVYIMTKRLNSFVEMLDLKGIAVN